MTLIVKQLAVSSLNDFGRSVVSQCFGGFVTPRAEEDPEVVQQRRFLEDVVGFTPGFDLTQARRFAGDFGLERGRYYTLCQSESGDDGGTLMNELRAYYDPSSAGLVDVFDTTVPSSRERLPQFVIDKLSGRAAAQRAGHLVLVVRPLGGKPFPMKSPPFAVALPLSIQSLNMERAIDLRDRDCAQWFARKLSTLTWSIDGKDVAAFPSKPPLSAFAELLPSLYTQALGGSAGATQIAGVWLRQLAADGVIFPSARTDSYVMVNDGTIQGWSGWNLVDYRGAAAPMFANQVDTMPCWPTWIAAEPRDVSSLDRPIIFASAAVESIDDGPAAGSWRITGLENTRSALGHTAELLFCLGTRLDMKEDPRVPYLVALMMARHRPAPDITMPPWTAADIYTQPGIDWQATFSAAVKDVFFGDSIRGNFGSLVFGDKRSRGALDNFVASVALKSGGQLPPDIEALISVLREIANSYRMPYGPSLFFDGDVLSSARN